MSVLAKASYADHRLPLCAIKLRILMSTYCGLFNRNHNDYRGRRRFFENAMLMIYCHMIEREKECV